MKKTLIKYKTIFISDVHLGCADCKIDQGLRFVETTGEVLQVPAEEVKPDAGTIVYRDPATEKLVETPVSERVELYKLDDDPGELNDLAELEPDIRDRLRDRLEAWLTDALEEGAADTGISPEQAWWLQQLGYMGGEDGDR